VPVLRERIGATLVRMIGPQSLPRLCRRATGISTRRFPMDRLNFLNIRARLEAVE